EEGHQFLLNHELYKSHRSGEIADHNFIKFAYPRRWLYDVLAALDYFQRIDYPYDERFESAMHMIFKREVQGKWYLDIKHNGQVWFEMETVGEPSRWNTLRALRILKWWYRIKKKANF
ncbi:MAG: hypothetical protein OEZ01_10705, partial [Candidatus Heimdallarchaeota archaeon]|nr:hypothetical protein [Candidatus Heimdallarchaeota archaeon]